MEPVPEFLAPAFYCLWHHLLVKTRLVIDAFREQFRALFPPFLKRLNRRLVLERTLRNVVVVDLDVIAQGRFQFGG